ncbi:ABC transporter permease [Alkalihalobacterium bogoriense]|uniref:ABC transporter permease n=1 Tax=Alkalihalobacterium bogoriense TaxID=246272 RepID=UPI00047C12A8|nr:ABC transporter permease [Alkalihalobacterium bogoriense]
MREYMKEMLKRKDLISYLVKSGLKAEHRNSYLGYFWWLLDPLLNVLVYYFLVVIILHRGSDEFNYGVFLVIGLVAWRWISTTFNSSAKAITRYSSIINQVYLPKAMFPLTTTLTQMVNFSFGLIVVAIFLAFNNVIPGWHIVYLPVIIIVQLLLLMAVSMFVSYVCVFVRDIDNVINHVVRVMFYASPIIWEGGRLPAEYQWVVAMNPVAIVINSYRDILMFHRTPDLSGLLMIGIVSLGIVVLLTWYYSKNEHKIIKAL